ncbi:TVP38/TMEM64 family protein [Dactylosporangium vinaceum]|uniref:TVP38/TMEM64 family membrane protein n=1 Tax=Dactylosporangium vinaceum TaxID=53362 RepID=A0ABV5MLQ0_9ACTN|nr:TVP38/TMEM64 family protein [Dactylosporangium vinaceum]UAB96891.1 TVP38/TMEM64 family protein [Dactylosporangium vinaceum]
MDVGAVPDQHHYGRLRRSVPGREPSVADPAHGSAGWRMGLRLGRVRSDLTTPTSHKQWWRTGAAIRFGLLALLVVTLTVVIIIEHPTKAALANAVGQDHPLAPLIAIGGSAVLTTALAPRTLLAGVGGLVFGFAGGVLYIMLGITLGALIAHTVGRLLGRDFMARHLSGRLLQMEQAVAKRGIVAIVISRMIPLVPFGIANYIFGTTSVRMGAFIAGTFVGALPATLAYSALGSATARGDAVGMSIAGVVIATLGIGGSVGSLLIWRKRPRKSQTPVTA